jgi:hypothetical protein
VAYIQWKIKQLIHFYAAPAPAKTSDAAPWGSGSAATLLGQFMDQNILLIFS